MIQTILTFIKLLLYCVPFVVFAVISVKLNLPKLQRYKQVFFPIIALIYCILTLLFLDRFSDLILNAIRELSNRFDFLSFLGNIDFARIGIYIINAALVLGFILIKGLLFLLLPGLPVLRKLTDKVSGIFYYVRDEDEKKGKRDERYLIAEFGDAKRILSAMYYTMLVIFALLLIITNYLNTSELIKAPFYPAFGIIPLGELVAFLSGYTLFEKESEADKPENDQPNEPDYSKLVDIYSSLFGERLITSYEQSNADTERPDIDKLIENYHLDSENTLSQVSGLMYSYFSRLAASGKTIDEGYMRQTENLLNGKSVLFFTQFYSDVTDYVFLPAMRLLMRDQRILIVLGSGGDAENVTNWFYDGLRSLTGFDRLWQLDNIADADNDSRIIVLEAKNIYNQRLLSEKTELLSKVSAVFIIEANLLLGTMQVGLSCLVSYLRRNGNDPQYIIFDRNCDGLVDSLSHVLNKSIVQVNATPIGAAKQELLYWKADGALLHHKLGLSSSRYLGMGTELAIVALREKVSKVIWAAEHKFPVIDIRWIDSVYYSTLCKAAELPISQNEFLARFEFNNDPASIAKSENSFMTVEDEFNNAFEVARQFATRGTKQSFVNIISQNYWLRDYMTDNMEIFRQDPKSIPTIVADYQRGPGNAAYKLIIRMIEGPVEESDIRDTLDILGEDFINVYKSLRNLILKYFFRVDPETEEADEFGGNIDTALVITNRTEIDPNNLRSTKKRYYSIGSQIFISEFMSQLKIVYYLAEDEHNKDNYLDSAMYGHVFQKYLPGMLITLDGKYYEVMSISKNNGVIVRRAADHISSRKYYRTLRRYTPEIGENCITLGEKHSYNELTVEHIETDIRVDTLGYLEMSNYNDLKNAKPVELSDIEARKYRNKECIRIHMSNSTPEIRTTVAVLLNELFVTVFPDTYHYICAVTASDRTDELRGLMPELVGVNDDCIYIIEDSLIDLGLLINTDRYLIRFLEIICDALAHHFEKLSDDDSTDDEASVFAPSGIGMSRPDTAPDDDNANGGISGFIRKFLGKKRKRSDDDDDTDEYAELDFSVVPLPIDRNDTSGRSLLRDEEPDDSGITGDDSDSTVVTGNTNASGDELPYSRSFYLLYGSDAVPSVLSLDGTLQYLIKQGFGNSNLKQTRENSRHKKLKWYNYRFEAGTHYCDFCGAVLGEMYEVLDDGRERCEQCSSEAITNLRDFKKLYRKTRKQMEKIFGIKLKSKITINMCNADKIAEQLGEVFTPTPGYDGRTLGFAYQNGGSHDIFIENGAPALETEKTLIHEMTHIWQYSNLPDIFEGETDKLASEGMAVWAEVQYLTSIGLKQRASDYAMSRLMQNNEYGLALHEYLERFKIRNGPEVRKRTPFCCNENPLK